VSSKAEKQREKLKRAIIAVTKASREDADLDRRALAEQLGLTYSQIVNMEHGRRTVGLIDFILLAHAIGKDPAELLKRVTSW
jgi:transcriptional regulator with XRE-family HTH domain